jgi:hypothetical protein
LRVLKDPKGMSGEICCEWECECASLPPLSRGVYGRYASVVVEHLEVDVACYDETYGDLVVARFDKSGALQDVEYVDGFPSEGTPGGAPDGPRNGILEPGPDVGAFSSAAVDFTGRLHVAYFDQTAGALKHALRDNSQWSTHVVDDANVAGQYASLAIRPADGLPVISYFVTGLTDTEGRPASGVRLAVAGAATPTSAADWSITLLEQAPDLDACGHSCFAGAVCVLRDGDGGAVPYCGIPAQGCSPACASGQACVQSGAQPTCMALGNPPIEDLPRANGIFTSVATKDDTSVVAWFDNVQGDLRAVMVGPQGPSGVVVMDGDGEESHRDGNVGAYVSVGIDAVGKTLMVYMDQSAHELLYFHGASLTGGYRGVVDSGRGMPPGFHEMGAGASLSFGPDATVYVAYQEQSTLDLLLAQRGPDGTWTRSTLLTQGAFGFYSDVAVASSLAFVASVLPKLSETNELASELGIQVVSIP